MRLKQDASGADNCIGLLQHKYEWLTAILLCNRYFFCKTKREADDNYHLGLHFLGRPAGCCVDKFALQCFLPSAFVFL